MIPEGSFWVKNVRTHFDYQNSVAVHEKQVICTWCDICRKLVSQWWRDWSVYMYTHQVICMLWRRPCPAAALDIAGDRTSWRSTIPQLPACVFPGLPLGLPCRPSLTPVCRASAWEQLVDDAVRVRATGQVSSLHPPIWSHLHVRWSEWLNESALQNHASAHDTPV